MMGLIIDWLTRAHLFAVGARTGPIAFNYFIGNSLHSEATVALRDFQAFVAEVSMRTILALAALSSCFAMWDRFANEGAYSAALQRNILGAALAK